MIGFNRSTLMDSITGNGMTSNSLYMMEKSAEFLWTKQAAHLDNISNAETPGYKVKTVTFEDEFGRKLRAAMGSRNRDGMSVRNVLDNTSWEVDEDQEVTRMDGNGVDTTEQMVELVRSSYQLQYTYQTITSHLGRLGKAING